MADPQSQWAPKDESPKAYVLFIHGFAEHITRYEGFLSTLAAPPYSLHITAFDQRGHGKTSMEPLTATSPEIIQWKKEGKEVKLEKNGKRRTGGWVRVMPDIEYFVRREKERAGEKKLFLWGFSMGGGQVLAFATRPQAPPSKETLGMLAGIISGGPLIRQTKAAPALQVKAGSLIAGLGLGGFLIPTPMNYRDLSHNAASNEKAKADPFCEQVGSLKGVADMINGGISLDSPSAYQAWPQDLPLLMYHGEEDPICSSAATKRFHEGVVAKDKSVRIFEGMYHEVHNELEPTPSELRDLVGGWIEQRAGSSAGLPTIQIDGQTAKL
ncbi:acylglycerol lipase, partial [Tremellales sp. Uapishka_1]